MLITLFTLLQGPQAFETKKQIPRTPLHSGQIKNSNHQLEESTLENHENESSIYPNSSLHSLDPDNSIFSPSNFSQFQSSSPFISSLTLSKLKFSSSSPISLLKNSIPKISPVNNQTQFELSSEIDGIYLRESNESNLESESFPSTNCNFFF